MLETIQKLYFSLRNNSELNTEQGSNSLHLMVVMPDEQAHTDESEQEFEGYDENVYHNC